MGRQEQHLTVWGLLQDQPLHLIGRTSENIRIGNHYLRPMLKHSLQRLRRISRLGYDLHVWLILQQTPQSLPQQDMIVRQNAPNFLAAESSFSLYRYGGIHSFSFRPETLQPELLAMQRRTRLRAQTQSPNVMSL